MRLIDADSSPTINLIFCKDCKYMDTGVNKEGYTFYKCLNGRSYGGTYPNDYCSWGERKIELPKSEVLSVTQIANFLGKNPETVRRWIRDGKLKAEMNSRKEGFVVLKDDLAMFMSKRP